MLNIASFLTPLAARPDPNGAVANALHGRALEYNKTQEQNQLSEQTRHSKAEEGFQQGHLDLAKQEHADEMSNHERDLHTKLTEWAMGVLDKEGLDKAKEIAGPVLDAAGIGVDFGGGSPAQEAMGVQNKPAAPAPATPPDDEDGFAKLQAVQAANAAKEGVPEAPGEPAASYGPRPGESMAAYVARGKAQVKAEEPAPTTQELDNEATEGPQKAGEEEAERSVQGEAPKWRLYNKRTGETYGLIDPAKVDAINQKRAYEGAVAYSKGTPEPGKPIVEEFTRGARNEADLEKRMVHAERAESELNKTLRVEKNHKGGGVNPLGGPIDDKLLNQVNGQVRMYVSKAVDNSGVKLLNTKAQDAARIAGMISSGSSGAERQAFATQLHANFGGNSSEGERAFQMEQAGVINALLAKVDAWAKGGELPEGLKEEIHKVAQMQQEFARKYAEGIRDKATKDAMESPALGGLYDRALGHQLSPEERDKISAGVRNLGGVDGSGGAEPGSADEQFDKLGL
jgi:hypothetical protein